VNIITEPFDHNRNKINEDEVHNIFSENHGIFVELSVSEENKAIPPKVNNNHVKCFWKRYHGTFNGLRETIFDTSSSEDTQFTELWTQVPIKNDDIRCFRCISLAIYGDEHIYKHIIVLAMHKEKLNYEIDGFDGLVTKRRNQPNMKKGTTPIAKISFR